MDEAKLCNVCGRSIRRRIGPMCVTCRSRIRRAKNPGATREYRQRTLERAMASEALYRAQHRKKISDASRRWREKNPTHNRAFYLKQYGMTLADYETMLEGQNRRCAISGCNNKPKRAMQVDHDHVSGLVRGLICSNCNCGLGLLGDNAERLAAAIDYLRREPATKFFWRPLPKRRKAAGARDYGHYHQERPNCLPKRCV